MNTKEFANQMKAINKITDAEIRHIKADEIMCKALRDLGYMEGIEVFLKMKKYYS